MFSCRQYKQGDYLGLGLGNGMIRGSLPSVTIVNTIIHCIHLIPLPSAFQVVALPVLELLQ